jgi:hypothetical protein
VLKPKVTGRSYRCVSRCLQRLRNDEKFESRLLSSYAIASKLRNRLASMRHLTLDAARRPRVLQGMESRTSSQQSFSCSLFSAPCHTRRVGCGQRERRGGAKPAAELKVGHPRRCDPQAEGGCEGAAGLLHHGNALPLGEFDLTTQGRCCRCCGVACRGTASAEVNHSRCGPVRHGAGCSNPTELPRAVCRLQIDGEDASGLCEKRLCKYKVAATPLSMPRVSSAVRRHTVAFRRRTGPAEEAVPTQ